MTQTGVLVRAGLRGLTGAMMMSGFRQVTTNLGLMDESPPETMMKQIAPDEVDRLPTGVQKALTELAHWSYGAVGGVVFGLLPERVREHPAAGPAYGVAVWLSFELGIAPMLGLQNPQGKVVGRTMMLADHAMYGVVVAGSLAPELPMARQHRT